MQFETATPSGATVDAPASMDSILAEFETGTPADAADEVVKELVEDTKAGDADEAAEPEGDETDASEEVEETAEEEPEAEDGSEPTYKVKVSGEEVEVPLSELLKGYSRERDYTTKTQALAEERKAVEARSKELDGEYASKLKQATDRFLKLDPILAEAANIDWQALAQEDPATYVQLQAAVSERHEAVKAANAEIARIEAERSQAEAAQAAEAAKVEASKLIEAMPELSDEARMGEFAKDVVGYLREARFEDGEIADLLDHRALLIVDKARRYDALQKERAALPQKKVVPKPAVKPLKSDAGDSQPPRKRLSPNASRDQRVAHVLDQFFEQG